MKALNRGAGCQACRVAIRGDVSAAAKCRAHQEVSRRISTRQAGLPAPRAGQRGFAMLLVFLMASAVALLLYMQLPRVAFESERDKEQILIDRGEQYKRAIALYFTEYKRFPSKIEDLESTNNKRYLRRRYVDPYTGKDEWRLVHTNGMYLTDSLVQKPPDNPANPTGSGQTQVAGATGGTTPTGNGNPGDPNAPPAVNAAVLARPSDRQLTANSSFGNSPGGGAFPQQGDPFNSGQVNTGFVDPASFPPISLFPNGYNAPSQQAGQPAQIRPQQGFPGQGIQGGFQGGIQPGVGQPAPFPQPGVPPQPTGQNGAPGPAGFVPNQDPSQPNQPFFPGQPAPGQPVPGQPFPGQPFPGQAGQPFPGQPAPGQGFQPNFPPGVAGVPGLNPNFPNQFPQNPNAGFPNAGQPNPGFNAQPGFNPQAGFNPQPGFNTQPGAGGAAGPPNQALNLINQLLTTPRQPPPGIGGTPAGNQTVGGGIAGVASTFTGPTIKSYVKRTKFEEWEFVYQLPQVGVPGQTGANPANPANPTSPGSPANPTAPGAPGPGAPGQPFNPTGAGAGPSSGLPPLP